MKEEWKQLKDLTEKTIKVKSIYEGKIISLQVEEVELPNGKRSSREVVKHPGAVAIIPFTQDGKLILVRQYRKALGKEIFEIPAGKLEAKEDPHHCALRELEEETGYIAKELKFVTSFYTSPGFADELIYVYEANNLSKGVASPDQDEFVEKVAISLEEGFSMMKKELIHDAKTIFALSYWHNKFID